MVGLVEYVCFRETVNDWCALDVFVCDELPVLLFVLRIVFDIIGLFVLLIDRTGDLVLEILPVRLELAVCVFDNGAVLLCVMLGNKVLVALFELVILPDEEIDDVKVRLSVIDALLLSVSLTVFVFVFPELKVIIAVYVGEDVSVFEGLIVTLDVVVGVTVLVISIVFVCVTLTVDVFVFVVVRVFVILAVLVLLLKVVLV